MYMLVLPDLIHNMVIICEVLDNAYFEAAVISANSRLFLGNPVNRL